MDSISEMSVAPESSVSQTNVEIQSNTAQPTPSSRHTAACWNFFTFPEKPGANTKLKCFLCKKEFKFNPNTSSNLAKHCRESHPKEYKEFGGKVQNTTRGSQIAECRMGFG